MKFNPQNQNSRKQKRDIGNGKRRDTMTALKKGIKALRPGDILETKIHSLGPNELGISELSNGYTIFIPKGQLEDLVRVKILKVQTEKSKFAIGEILDVLKKGVSRAPVSVGETFDFTVTSNGPRGAGIIQLPGGYQIYVPNSKATEKVSIQISRVKASYAFAKKQSEDSLNNTASLLPKKGLNVGNKYTLYLPKQANQKTLANYVTLKINGEIVFIKMGLGAKLGDKVQIQITQNKAKFSVGKIVKISPNSRLTRNIKIRSQLRQMVANGVHYGEKSIKCNANMKKYVWMTKKSNTVKKPFLKKGRHLINLFKTRRCLAQCLIKLEKYAAQGRTFLFVGTTKSAAGLIARAALLTQTSFFVNTRWLGGMLTNWKTILKSISKIRPILIGKQKILKSILEKRQEIQKQLLQRVNELRKKSRILIAKGKLLIEKVRKNKNGLLETSQSLLAKRNELLEKSQLGLTKYKGLKTKKKFIYDKILSLKEKAIEILQKKNSLINQLSSYRQKIQNYQLLLSIGQEIRNVNGAKFSEGSAIWSISYNTLSSVDSENLVGILPQPPKEILNKIIKAMRQKYQLSSALNSTGQTYNYDSLEKQGSSLGVENNKALLMSKLLSQFIKFLPFLKTYIKVLALRVSNIQILLLNCQTILKNLQTKISQLMKFQNSIDIELTLLKNQLNFDKQIAKKLKAQLDLLASEQRLLKFLPKLRYLPTPKSKMAETIQVLMKKFVDPKLRYPMDDIYAEKLKLSSKKIAAARKKKWQRLEKYFGGVTKMAKLQNRQISKNIAIIVGQREETNAVSECQKLGIKMVHVVDTNCNPRLADHVIPANDDSRNSIKFVLDKILKRIRLAQKLRQKVNQLRQRVVNLSASSRIR